MKISSVAQNEKKRFYAVLDMNTLPGENEYSHLPCIHHKGKHNNEIRLIFPINEAKNFLKEVDKKFMANNQLFFLKKISDSSKKPDSLYVVADLNLSLHKDIESCSDVEEIAATMTPSLIPIKYGYERYIMNYEDAVKVKDNAFESQHLRIYLLQPHKPKS